jgi:hypothetical protein
MIILIILLIIGLLILLAIGILDKFIIKLPESSKFKRWWEQNIIGNEDK